MESTINLSEVIINEIGLNNIELFTKYRIDYLSEMQGEPDLVYKEKLLSDLQNYFTVEFANNRIFAFIAMVNTEVLGFGAMIIKRIPGDMYKTIYSEGEILNMYTLKHARRKGISSLILSKLIEEGVKRGLSKISLHTSADGEKLYRKFKFSEPIYPVLELIIT